MCRKPKRTQCSAPPTLRADSLAHRQSENPTAQTADSQPPQTSHVESDQTKSMWLRKLPAQLNTPNRNVPDLVRVSPNASDVQRLGRCVPALRCLTVTKHLYVLPSSQRTCSITCWSQNHTWLQRHRQQKTGDRELFKCNFVVLRDDWLLPATCLNLSLVSCV